MFESCDLRKVDLIWHISGWDEMEDNVAVFRFRMTVRNGIGLMTTGNHFDAVFLGILRAYFPFSHGLRTGRRPSLYKKSADFTMTFVRRCANPNCK